MMISVQVTTSNAGTFNSIDSVPSAVVIHSYDALSHLEKVLAELKTPERLLMGGGTSGVTNGVFFNMTIHNVNRERFCDFIDTYAANLAANMHANPEQYMGTFETTLANMKVSILKGTFNKDSESFKQTCKALKIKHTYKAIDEFIGRVK